MAEAMDTFEPGLFPIGLNTEKKLINHYFFIQLKSLSNELEKETIYINPVIRNIQAMFFFSMETGRMTARSILEEIIVENPKDLNALADLIYVYKEMGLEEDSDKCRTKLESYKEDQLSQAKCVLGQAYFLARDFPDDQSNSPRVLLKDTWSQLNANRKHPEQISKATKLIVEAYKVVNEIPETSNKKTIDELKMVADKFEKGIKMLENLKCSAKEILVWKQNLAIFRIKINKRAGDESKHFENYRQALETHLDVIEYLSPFENLEEPMKIYLAKSYVSFVRVLELWKYENKNIEIPERIENQDIDFMLEKAIEICPNDHKIWKMYGQYWKYIHISKAIHAFSRCIDLLPDPDVNWFAYWNRSHLYYMHSLQLIKTKSDEDEINQKLLHAYDDGKVCLQSSQTFVCRLKMAQICFQLAKPDLRSFHCKDILFIYEAIDIIHEAFKVGDIRKDAMFNDLLGKCYSIIGEHRRGIESLKTVLELNKWSENFPGVFKVLTKCFMAFYEEANDTNLLTEFHFMLKEAKKRNLDDWVTNAMKMVHYKNTEMMRSLVRNMIEWDAKGCEMIIRKALKYEECQPLMEEFERKLQEEDNQETEINGRNEIQNSQRSVNFKHDFFVSHSEKDKDWVNNMLRPQLEEYDDNIKFKGFIPSRDFIPGERVFESIHKGIKVCRKLVILLTPNYLENNWKGYMNDASLSRAIKREVQEKTILPIVLERCNNIPDVLTAFTPIDFTEENDWDELRMRLHH